MPPHAPSRQARGRGCLLGLAAGNALGLPTERLGSAAAIRAVFPDGLADIQRRDTPESPWDDDTALAVITAESLAPGQIDLRAMAHRAVAWRQRDGRGIGDWTRRALDHIATHDAPPADSGGRATNGSLARCIPIALATLATPKNLVSGSWHVARLLHPDERCAWGAVAINVAASRLLSGYRDFVPEVIDVLRANDAPPELVEAVRRVPLSRKDALPVTADPGYVVHTVEIALWFAYHEPLLERGLTWLVNAGGDTDTNAAVAGALMGARDGAGAIPERWRTAVARTDHLEALADALLGLGPPP